MNISITEEEVDKFDTSDLTEEKDWFLGCDKCYFRLDKNTSAKPECPNCNSKMYIYELKS
jgi:ABC-type ATPase with predicted acetyltransferase domain